MKRGVKKQRTLLRLLREAKPVAPWLAAGACLDVLSVLCAVAAPEILGALVQRLYDFWTGGCVGSISASLISGLAALALVYLGSAGFGYCNMQVMNRGVSRHFTCNVRIALSDKLRRLSVRYVDQTAVGDILNRLVGDVSEMGGYVHQIFDLMVKGVFQIVVISAIMFVKDWRLALMVLLLTPVSIALSTRIASISEKHYDTMFELEGKLSDLVEEDFSNYTTTKAYNLEGYTQNKHAQVNGKLKQATAKATFTGAMVQPLIALCNSLAYILINLVGGFLVVKRGASVGVVVTIVLFARQFASPLEQLASGFSQINRVKSASTRVFAVMDMEEEQEPPHVMEKTPQGFVRFENVTFSYQPDEPLIEKLNLSVLPGQKVAIVGPTGAGKTTIVNLLMRFYDPNAGTISLDGEPTAQMSRDSVRACFGMVLQDTWLLRGSIAENVAYGCPNATREQIVDACRKTYCDHFIRTMPDGYETVIGEDTTNLSGGQRQLLTIARALLANRPLLILDEATSNVDTRTEVLIQKAMDRLMAGRTCFVIAHRLSTIVDADVILVLDHGRIVEQGKHEALLAKKGFYYRLYTSQYAI